MRNVQVNGGPNVRTLALSIKMGAAVTSGKHGIIPDATGSNWHKKYAIRHI